MLLVLLQALEQQPVLLQLFQFAKLLIRLKAMCLRCFVRFLLS